MPSVNDWAAKAAERIEGEYIAANNPRRKMPSKERIAAIIATFAEPLQALLRDAKQKHYHCPAASVRGAECTCGADAWNARVDAALAGEAVKKAQT